MQRSWRYWAEQMLCLAVLAAAPCLWLAPSVIDGKAPYTADAIYFLAPWAEARPDALDAPRNPDHEAIATRFYPFFRYLSAAAQDDTPMTWNPLEGGGLPFYALWEARVFSPFSLPFYVLDDVQALWVSVLLKLLAAGLAAFIAGRRFALSAPVALALALAFQLAPPLSMWAAWPLADALPWTPLFFLGIDHTVMKHRGIWTLTSASLALMLLGGAPDAALCAAVFGLGVVVFRHAANGVSILHVMGELLRYAAIVLLGLFAAAVAAFPAIEAWLYRAPIGQPDTGLGHAADVAFIMIPQIFGETSAAFARDGQALSPNTAFSFYVGVTPLLFAALWLSARPYIHTAQRRRIEGFTLMGLVFMAAAFIVEPLRAFDGVPLPSTSAILFAQPFAFALLGLAAAEEWVHLDPRQCHNALMRFAVAAPAVLAAWITLAAPGLLTALPFDANAWVHIAVFLALGGVLIGATLVTAFRPSARILGYTAAAVAVLNLTVSVRPYIVFEDPSTFFPETRFIRSLAGQEGRIAGTAALADWPLAGNGIAQADSASGVQLVRHADFMARVREEALLIYRAGAKQLLLGREDIRGPFSPYRARMEIDTVFPAGAILFTEMASEPRARLVYAVRVVEEHRPSLIALDSPPTIESPALIQPALGPEGNASIVEDETDRVRIRVSDTRPGYLVLADAWYPGWQATLNGEPAPISPVDGLFRGVALPAGEHDVIFEFDPPIARIGLAASSATAAFLALVAGFAMIRRMRRPVEQKLPFS